MKRNLISVLVVIAISAVAAVAQSEQQPSNPAPQTTAGQAQPAAGQAQPAAGQAAQAPAGAKMPQPKTKAEYDAYVAIANEPDLAKATADAENFQKQFPESEVTPLIYQLLMRKYRSANNAGKALEMAQKVIQLDPGNPEALITAAAILAETTHSSDLDSQQKYAEAVKDAQEGLDNMETKLHVPSTATPEQVTAYKNGLKVWAYSSMGAVNMAQENWPAAEQALRKAVELNKDEPDAIVLYRLALTLDKQNKYSDALSFATESEQVAGNSPFKAQIQQEKQRLQQLTANAPAGGAPKQ